MSSDNVRSELSVYLKEMKRFSLLSPKQEKEMGIRAKNGDPEAKKKLVEANLRLAIWIARKYRGYLEGSLSFLDLIQEGNLGLIRAAQDFDPKKGKFDTYANYWIRFKIAKALREHKDIHISYNALEGLNQIKKSMDDFYKENGRKPTSQEISRLTGLSVEKIEELLKTPQIFISLERPVKNDDLLQPISYFLKDEKAVNPEEAVQKKEMMDKETQALSALRPREEKVLRKRFVIGERKKHTLQEIGDEFKVSRERIRQIEKRALRRIKKEKRNSLEDFL